MLHHRTVYSRLVVLLKSHEINPYIHHKAPQRPSNKLNQSTLDQLTPNQSTAMTSLGDIQRQFSQLLTTIKAHELELEDAMPQELQDQFQDMAVLKDAREYITEIEAKEKDLDAANITLKIQLQAKQAEIDNQPAEFKSLVVELQQVKRRVDYYKDLSDHEQVRADRCERKLKEVIKLQAAADDDARRIQRLQQDVANSEAATFKLLEQNRTLADQHEAELERFVKLNDDKDNTIFALRNMVHQLEAEKTQVDQSSEEEIDTYGSLLDTLEQEKESASQVANSKTALFYSQQQFNDKLYATIASQLAPLNRFNDCVVDVLGAYQDMFDTFSDPSSLAAARIPDNVYTLLDIADDHLGAYQDISAELQGNSDLGNYGEAQGVVVYQVSEIARSAAMQLDELNNLDKGVQAFLNRMRGGSKPWRFGFGGSGLLTPTPTQGNGALTPTQSSASSRSSVSSFSSFTKRFSVQSASSQ
jgi:hypothetical protein